MATRLVVELANGSVLAESINLTGIPNANAMSPLRIIIEQQCNKGTWHRFGSVNVPCYDLEDYDPSVMTNGTA